jgi:hypothetical protein
MYDFDVVLNHVTVIDESMLEFRINAKKSSGFVKSERKGAIISRRRLWVSMLRSDRDQVRHICTPWCRVLSPSVEFSTFADAGIECEALLF